MIAENDAQLRAENACYHSVRMLGASLRTLLLVACALALMQIGLIVWIFSQCITIDGLAINGRIFKTDSLSCPSSDVEPLFDHAKITSVTRSSLKATTT